MPYNLLPFYIIFCKIRKSTAIIGCKLKMPFHLRHQNPPSLSTMLKCAGRFFSRFSHFEFRFMCVASEEGL